MNAYFFKMNKEERNNILDQHKKVYDGYVTRYNQESNEMPLYTQDFANDKGGITVNNKGNVKTYTNVGINEAVLDTIGDGPNDLENGTVDLNPTNNRHHEMMHDTYPSPNEDEEEFVSLGNYYNDMRQNLDQYEYDIDEMEDYSSDELYEMYHETDLDEEYEDVEDIEDEDVDQFNFDEVDEDEVPDLMSNINESLDMFRRFKKYN
jgi:hypothetical protein